MLPQPEIPTKNNIKKVKIILFSNEYLIGSSCQYLLDLFNTFIGLLASLFQLLSEKYFTKNYFLKFIEL
jgi:hypothetical protein